MNQSAPASYLPSIVTTHKVHRSQLCCCCCSIANFQSFLLFSLFFLQTLNIRHISDRSQKVPPPLAFLLRIQISYTKRKPTRPVISTNGTDNSSPPPLLLPRLYSIMMDNQNVHDGELDSSFKRSGQLISSLEVSDSAGFSDPVSYEKLLLESMDSHWDDLNTRLIVSRMVNDAVIKGMATAVAQDAADKIRMKEAQMVDLNERLLYHEFHNTKSHTLESPIMQDKLRGSNSESHSKFVSEQNYDECLHCLKAAAEEQVRMLTNQIKGIRSFIVLDKSSMILDTAGSCSKEELSDNFLNMEESLNGLTETLGSIYQQITKTVCFFENSFYEQQYRSSIQKEVLTIIFQNHITQLKEQFDALLVAKNYRKQRKSFSKGSDSLTSLRNELDDLNKSLVNSEYGYLLSFSSNEDTEWHSADRRDSFPRKILGNQLKYSSEIQENGANTGEKSKNSILDVFESTLLSHMSRDELIGYFKIEVTKMTRNHDIAIQQKTEELFAAKREILNKKGFKRDPEYEILRKRIPELIHKLDNVLIENETLSVEDDYVRVCQDQYDKLTRDNQHLRDLLADKKKEIKFLSRQVSELASQISHHSSVEAKYLKQITSLRGSIEDTRVEANLREELISIVLREMISEIDCHAEISKMEVNFEYEINTIILQGLIGDVGFAINIINTEYVEQKQLLEAVIMQKDKALCLEIEKTMTLKNELESLLKLANEKNKSAQQVDLKLMQQKEQLEVVCKELCMLKEREMEQDILISQIVTDSELLNSELQKSNNQIDLYKEEISKQNELLNDALRNLEEAMKLKTVLHENIKQKDKSLEAIISQKRRLKEGLMSMVCFVNNLSKSLEDFESDVEEKIQRNKSRLKKLTHQVDPIMQQVEIFRQMTLLYKKNFDTNSSNLQKAEIEVDLLGDEVDALLAILVKVYIALDHYSPVLQHYSGVMEILHLVRREIEGNAKLIQFRE